ncbi:MAG TPA: FtsX-like permease family protein [Usitatibacteraceae bacterium]|nr:FtsX-like permease family protein [Usitatibacteraceae bacterium]
MRVGALDRKILRDAWHMRGQILACALVVAGGINSFVSLSSVNRTLAASQAAFYEEYRFADVFAGLVRAPEHVSAALGAIPGIATLETRVAVRVNLDVPGLAEPARGRIISISRDAAGGLNALHLRRGRMPAAMSQDEVLASEAFAIANGLQPGDSIRGVMNGRYKKLTVVGVAISPEFIYALGPGQLVPDNRRYGVLWMDRRGLATAYDMEGAFNDVTARVSPGASVPAVLGEMDRLLATYGGIGAYDREDQLSHRFLSDEIAQNRTMSRITPTIFLLVGAFLLYTILTRLVQMQRSQVGLLKAFGYSGAEIALHYLKLALVISLIGAALGVATGLPFARYMLAMYAEYYYFPMYGNDQVASVAAAGVALAVAAAALGAVPAALRGARLAPADSMRPEPPPRFHAGVLERWGLRRALPPAGRMMIRNLARRPLRFIANVTGIAIAVSLLVMMSAMLDGVRRLMEWQFTIVQREDIQVLLVEPRTRDALDSFRAMHGVTEAEPFRLAAARLHSGYRMKRGLLFGLEEGPTLRRVVGGDGRAYAIPREGVLLTAIFAGSLGVRAGDSIEVEVMEGKRARETVLVVGIVDEPIGYAAYVSRATANRLMREGDVLTGVYLRVDADERARIFAELKAMPLVAGANLREAAYAQFNAMIDRSVGIMITVNLVFAWIIAFGLVYNGARIALSERGYELATLRVLGFTQRETASLLLGEQGVITLVGLPAGLALGIALTLYFIWMLSTQMWRMPYVMTGANLVGAMVAVAAAAVASGGAVAWKLRRLDLVAALKARE